MGYIFFYKDIYIYSFFAAFVTLFTVLHLSLHLFSSSLRIALLLCPYFFFAILWSHKCLTTNWAWFFWKVLVCLTWLKKGPKMDQKQCFRLLSISFVKIFKVFVKISRESEPKWKSFGILSSVWKPCQATFFLSKNIVR